MRIRLVAGEDVRLSDIIRTAHVLWRRVLSVSLRSGGVRRTFKPLAIGSQIVKIEVELYRRFDTLDNCQKGRTENVLGILS